LTTIDEPKSIRKPEEVFSKKKQKQLVKEEQLVKHVLLSWISEIKEEESEWSPCSQES